MGETVTSSTYGTYLTTDHGTYEIVYQVTLGDIAIVTVVSLLVILLVLQWIISTIWGRRS